METLHFIESGRRRKAEKASCEECNIEFLRRLNGKQKFCSKICTTNNKDDKVEVICFSCGTMVKRRKSQLKLSKSGIYFCSRECKEKEQKLDGKCDAIKPSHYGTSEGRGLYQNLISNLEEPKCEGCGEVRRYLLCVHHKDGDRTNNVLDNLEVVCSNCHTLRHLKFEDGQWKFCTKCLTPRDRLKELGM